MTSFLPKSQVDHLDQRCLFRPLNRPDLAVPVLIGMEFSFIFGLFCFLTYRPLTIRPGNPRSPFAAIPGSPIGPRSPNEKIFFLLKILDSTWFTNHRIKQQPTLLSRKSLLFKKV